MRVQKQGIIRLVCGISVLIVLGSFTLECNAATEESSVARIKSFKNKVKFKPDGGMAWKGVSNDMKLYHKDRIRTMEKSTATVEYNNITTFQVKENSLVVIKNVSGDTIQNLLKAKVELSEGALTGTLDNNSSEEDVVMEITLKPFDTETVIEFDSRGLSKKTSVTISLEPNKDVFVHVASGKAKVTSLGKTVELKENQSTIVEPNAKPKDPWRGNKKPFNRVVLICILFVSFFIVVSAAILFKNRKEMSG